MKLHFTYIISFLVTLTCTASAQDLIAHMRLTDGRVVSGVILYVRSDAVIIQEDARRIRDEIRTYADSAAILENSSFIEFRNIAEFELERSSSSWLIGFPGLPLVTLIVGPIVDPPNDETFDGFGRAIAFLAALPIGAITAVALHYIFGADWDIDVNDPDDIETLKKFALLQDNEQNGIPLHE